MHVWLTEALALIDRQEPAIVVSVVGTRGSAPRDSGTRMIVCNDRCIGTIGGGHLEYKAIALAREQLQPDDFAEARVTLRRFPLGASLGQCCGGLVQLLFEPLNREEEQGLQYIREHHEAGRSVMIVTQAVADAREKGRIADIRKLLVSEYDSYGELDDKQQSVLRTARERLCGDHAALPGGERSLWFEKLPPVDFHILIFGAGHVGKALVNVLSTLPCHITWVDSRAEEFPALSPPNVRHRLTEDPEEELAEAAAGSYVLILTHNHALDESICAQALQNDSLAWCGLIGSASKRRKFIQRFRARGLSDASIARLTCPIGLPGLNGKHPGEIAVSVAAQLLELRQQQRVRQDSAGTAITQHEFS